MPVWSRLRSWLRGNLSRSRMESDMDVELKFHIEAYAEDLVRSGVPRHEASRLARLEFGGVERAKEECREARSVDSLESLAQDVRYTFRMLRKSPGFSAIVILTIALGIGATTAIFSVVDATLLHPLPYPQPDQLVSIEDDLPGVGAHDAGMSEPEWQDLQRSGIFEHVSPVWYDENNLTGASQPTTVRLLIVAPNYLSLLGVKAQLGRAFHPEDHSPGLLPEVVISDGLWKRAFGADRNILDKSLRLDTDLYRIIGVTPAGFCPPGRTTEERNVEAWIATSFYGPPMPDHPSRARRNLPTSIARLKQGLTIAVAQSRVDALVASLQKQFPVDYPAQHGWTIRLVPLKEAVVGNVRQSLLLLLGAVGLVLLIGCVNVANLLLARASSRGREFALRQALGAERFRLARQLLTESMVLSLFGGITGLAILFFSKGFLLRLVPASLPRLNSISISWGVLLFAFVAALATGVIFGLAPAFDAGRFDLIHALKEAGRGSTGSGRQARTRRALVITEFALSLVLMIAASLLLRSFWDLLNVRLGFSPQNVLSLRTRLPYPNDPANDKYATDAQEAAFVRELVLRSKTLPGVEEVALGDPASIPLDQSQRELNRIVDGYFLFTLEGRDIQTDQAPVAERTRVTPGYFHLLGIPLLRGRFFDDADSDKTPQAAVVNEAFGRMYWPNEDPLGKRFKSTRANAPWITVVGITANARTETLAQAEVPQIYLDLYQDGAKHLAIFLRGHLDAAIPAQVREQVQSLDPTLPVFGSTMLDETLSASLAEKRFSMEMVALFALTALLLAALGIYGVISYLVSERTHEIGIRLTLGASRSDILHAVLRQGLRLAVSGAAVGLVFALIVSHLMAGLLYEVKPTDPLTFIAVAALLIGVALLASYVPARRAMRVDPMCTLRDA